MTTGALSNLNSEPSSMASVSVSAGGSRGQIEPESQSWQDNPLNPQNWPTVRQYIVTILLSSLSFSTLMSSTMVAPALQQISKDLVISNNAETQLVLSIYVLAYAVGYFFWAPLSEVYGRKRILQIANSWFCIWNLTCGFAPNKATLTIGRLFSGAGGAASLAVSTGAMGEIWRPVQRGRSLAILSVVALLGPAIGPIIGGAIAERSMTSWRWAFWSTSMLSAVLQLLSFRFLHESHVPTLLRHIPKKNTKIAKDISSEMTRTTRKILLTAIKRPFYLMATQHASQGLILQAGISFGTIYIILSVLSKAFTEIYGQELMIASLNYLSFGIGMTLGAQAVAPIIDKIYQRGSERHLGIRNLEEQAGKSGELSPRRAPAELRLWPFIPTVLLLGAGLLVFGWGVERRAHWIVPNIGIALFGMGSQATTQCSNAYMIDTFSEIRSPRRHSVTSVRDTIPAASLHEVKETSQISINWSASAMASIWAIKSLGGFTFPLFAVDMIEALGWGWSCTLLSLLNFIVGIPVAILLLVYGETLRKRGQRRIEKSMEDGTI